MAKLISAGHASLDLPFRPVGRNVFERDTVFVEKLEVLIGGDALNVSVGLTKLGMGDDICFVTVMGDDTFGELLTRRIREHHIKTDGIIVKSGVNSIVTAILIDENNERHFVFSGNSARNLTVDDVIKNFGDDTLYLHIGSFMSLDGLEHDNMRRLFCAAKEQGIHTSFDVTYDLSGEWIKKIRPGLPFTDIFFASYDEAVAISGLYAPHEMAAFFAREGVKSFVLKMGDKGCFATDYKTNVEMPAYTGCSVIDTTGAGDSFVAAYLYGVINGFSMEECCVLGNANGSLAVGALGANTGSGTAEKIAEFIRTRGAGKLDANQLAEKIMAAAVQ